VADTDNDRIVLFNKQGKFLFSFGESGSGPGQFNRPVGLSLGRAGRLFVADSGNNRIQVLKVKY
jgi:DNA-binding beta-propeller fold protein YncE